MSRIHKISFLIIVFTLCISIIIGIVTRNSYKYLDRDNAEVFLDTEYSEECIYNLDSESLIKELEKNSYAFVVTVKSSENIHESTKTVAVIDKIVKGNGEQVGNEIIIHEPNFFTYNKINEEQFYYYVNRLSNIMQENNQYLVFVNKVKFSKAYQQTLQNTEYAVGLSQKLYAFPLNKEIMYINSENTPKIFGELKKYDYFCYSKESAEKLNQIKNSVFEYFL